MSNLEIWDRFADIDPSYTKPITGKQYKGTSPNPQYVIKCLTEVFGPVGVGFGWDVEREEFTPIGDEILHWCRIRFWHTDRANGFSSYGQTKALMKTRNGFMTDEDAPKKSLTDAIVKSASHVGIAANIFLGRWDDSKYVDAVREEYRAKEAQNVSATNAPQTVGPDAVKIAVDYMREAGTLIILRDRWVSLPDAMKRHGPVADAKEDRKAVLEAEKSRPTDSADSDEIPY